MEHNPQIRPNRHRWLFYDRLDSTNREAQRQIRDHVARDGDIIWTNDQYDGQGQRGKRWNAAPGQNIAMSLTYIPHDLSVDRVFLVNEMVAVAVARALEKHLGCDASIKWPNDIYIEFKKVAGLLIQNGLKGKKVDHLIIGIGINVNQERFPDHLPNPGSLKLLMGKSLDREELMSLIVEEIDFGMEDIYRNEGQRWHEQFESRMLLLRRSARFRAGEEDIEGKIRGVDGSGRLILETSAGLQFFNTGSIEYDKSSFIDDWG